VIDRETEVAVIKAADELSDAVAAAMAFATQYDGKAYHTGHLQRALVEWVETRYELKQPDQQQDDHHDQDDPTNSHG